MEARILIKLSAIIDKMNIDAMTMDENDSNLQFMIKTINKIIKNLYKAENEVYELIAVYKNIDIESAKKEDIIPIIKEIIKIEGVQDFLEQ